MYIRKKNTKNCHLLQAICTKSNQQEILRGDGEMAVEAVFEEYSIAFNSIELCKLNNDYVPLSW